MPSQPRVSMATLDSSSAAALRCLRRHIAKSVHCHADLHVKPSSSLAAHLSTCSSVHDTKPACKLTACCFSGCRFGFSHRHRPATCMSAQRLSVLVLGQTDRDKVTKLPHECACSMTSFESPKTWSLCTPSACAAVNPRISAVYSASLFVACPRNRETLPTCTSDTIYFVPRSIALRRLSRTAVVACLQPAHEGVQCRPADPRRHKSLLHIRPAPDSVWKHHRIPAHEETWLG